MPLKDIKNYVDMCTLGDTTLETRHKLFLERRQTVMEQMKVLQEAMDIINYKVEYYEKALEAGSEHIHQHRENVWSGN